MINENPKTIAKEITDKILTMKDFTEKQMKKIEVDYHLSYEFDISNGKCTNKISNTSFLYDCEIGSETYNYMKYIYSREETPEIKQEESDFKNLIISNIKEHYLDSIRETLLSNLKIPLEIMPMKEIEINSLDIIDFSSIPYLNQYTFIIKKYNKNQDTTTDKKGISDIIANEINIDKNVTLDYIVAKHHSLGTEEFKNIESIKKGGKYIYNVAISLFVDYSIVTASK